ncbi:MAG: hypothetical protein AAF677_16555 [Pseudomonadota bacterium]
MSAALERKTRQQLSKTPHFAAILPLREGIDLDMTDIVKRMERTVEGSGARVLLHPNMRKMSQGHGLSGMLGLPIRPSSLQMLYVVIDHVGIWVAAREGIMEHRGPLQRWANPDLWPEGPERIARHRAWIEICDLGFMRERGVAKLDRAFNRAAAVTAATAAVASACEALGVLWYPAKNAVPLEQFAKQFDYVIDGHAPIELWLRYLFTKSPDPSLHDGVVTKGLAAFTDYEIEVLPSMMDPQDAKALAFQFARLVVDRGTEPRTGMMLTPSRHFTASVRVGESQQHKGLKVFELTVAPRIAAGARG